MIKFGSDSKKLVMDNYPYKISFYLKSYSPSTQPQNIRLILAFNNQRLFFSGIDKVEPRYWNIPQKDPNNSQKTIKGLNDNTPKQVLASPHVRIRKNMKKAERIIREAFESYTNEHNSFPTDIKSFSEICRSKLKGETKPSPIPKELPPNRSFLKHLEMMRDEIKDGIRKIPGTKQIYAPNTYKSYGSLIFNLKEFLKSYDKTDLAFSDINLQFYRSFEDFVINKENKSPNYFGSLIKNIKSAMNDSHELKLHDNQEYTSRRFAK